MDQPVRISEGSVDYALRPPTTPAAGLRGCMRDLLQLMGADASALPPNEDFPLPLRRLAPGDAVFHEGSRAQSIHVVRGGTFKIVHTAEDGYEQVLGFAGRGEVLGFDALCMDQHPTAAVALEDASVYVLRVAEIFSLGQHVPEFDRALHLASSHALTYRAQLADVMAAVAAEVRLARFLVQWSQRMAACGQSPRRFHLRMCRRDIASHLAVAHETVSRSFGNLVEWGLLQVRNRDIEILDLDRLKAFARSTRRGGDERAPAAPRVNSRDGTPAPGSMRLQ